MQGKQMWNALWIVCNYRRQVPDLTALFARSLRSLPIRQSGSEIIFPTAAPDPQHDPVCIQPIRDDFFFPPEPLGLHDMNIHDLRLRNKSTHCGWVQGKQMWNALWIVCNYRRQVPDLTALFARSLRSLPIRQSGSEIIFPTAAPDPQHDPVCIQPIRDDFFFPLNLWGYMIWIFMTCVFGIRVRMRVDLLFYCGEEKRKEY